MDIPFNKIEIDRGHGTGKPFLDKERQKKVLVKFQSWKVRAAFYKARPKNHVNGRKKPGLTSFSVSLDLKNVVTRYQQRSRVLLKIIQL